jgi:hypothetical protein
MNVIRMHGKMTATSGIVYIRNRFGNTTWVVDLDKEDPNNLRNAKLLYRIR